MLAINARSEMSSSAAPGSEIVGYRTVTAKQLAAARENTRRWYEKKRAGVKVGKPKRGSLLAGPTAIHTAVQEGSRWEAQRRAWLVERP